jgi:hypothetical protein
LSCSPRNRQKKLFVAGRDIQEHKQVQVIIHDMLGVITVYVQPARKKPAPVFVIKPQAPVNPDDLSE